MAASLPPLKSTFEALLRRFGVMTGLSTPGDTYENRSRTYGVGTLRSGHQRLSGGRVLERDLETANKAYQLDDMKSRTRTQVDAGSIEEEDQRHILKHDHAPGMQGEGWAITKTTEYSVSDDNMSTNDARFDGRKESRM
jgi:hypothetical protein